MSNLLEHNQSVIANIISRTKGLPTSTHLATKDDKIFEVMSHSKVVGKLLIKGLIHSLLGTVVMNMVGYTTSAGVNSAWTVFVNILLSLTSWPCHKT